MAQRSSTAWAYLALFVLCASLFTCTAPGRIIYPDDEIVFQTTQSLAEDHSLEIPGIAKRSGERRDRPTGTFGWGEGPKGERYGFFGHGLSVAALPLYAVARATADHVPETWRYVQRSDLITFSPRSPEGDWLRLVTSLTNCLLTPLAALLFGLWLSELGHGRRSAMVGALTYALGTTAWPYAGTFLSEPLSAVLLLGATLSIERWRSGQARSALWTAAALAGLSVHVHVLNLLAVPALLLYAWAPGYRRGRWKEELPAFAVALLIGGVGLGLLGLSQWLRYGSPLETGRFDHYAHWVWPWKNAAAMLVAPGRSLWIYSPPLILALLAWPRVVQERRDTAVFVGLLFALRWIFVACRSDWFGGWAIGPRYLVPLVPFLLVPLPTLLEQARSKARPLGLQIAARAGLTAAILASVAFQAWLAVHSIVQVLFNFNRAYTRGEFRQVIDWRLSTVLPLEYWRLQQPALAYLDAGNERAAMLSAQFEAMAFGAWRMSRLAHVDGLWHLLVGLGALGAVAGLGLGLYLVRTPDEPPAKTEAKTEPNANA